MADEVRTYPGDCNECYPEPFTKIPPPVSTKKPGQLSEDQIKQFFTEGFLVVEDFFTRDELEPCKEAISVMVDDLAKELYEAGKITKLHDECSLFQKLTELDKEFPGAAVLLFKKGILPKAFRDLWVNQRMLNVIEEIIGPDIAGHPVWNLRPKIPKNDMLIVPWHQDSAYFSRDSYDHMVPTAWIPLLDTNEFNGGMQVVKGGHCLGKVAKHTCCSGKHWYVTLEEEEMEKTLGRNMKEDIVNTPVPYGGFLLFHNLTPHRSLSNMSNDVRWSMDLRWCSPHQAWGFHNIAEGILFRTAENGNIEPDWKKFLSVNRKEIWQKRHYKEVKESDQFDTSVTGPWIGNWEIVNHNRHTEAFQKND